MALDWGDFLWSMRRYRRSYPAWTELEVDFGTSPVWEKEFTVEDASVSETSNVSVVASGKPATDRAVGDEAWDGLTASANPSAGSFTIYARATPGPVVGKRNLLYSIS